MLLFIFYIISTLVLVLDVSSNINEVIKTVLNFLSFILRKDFAYTKSIKSTKSTKITQGTEGTKSTKSTKKHQKARKA